MTCNRSGNKKTDSNNFFNTTGSEFPIRRGFRLWLQETLKTNYTDINDFIQSSINTPSVEQHWKDEILVSVLQSDVGFDFLQSNKKYLLENDSQNFGRFITVFRTACKIPRIQASTNRFTSWNFMPQGQGWGFLLRFMYENLDNLKSYYFSVIEFVEDWDNKIENHFQIDTTIQNEARQAGTLILNILTKHANDFTDKGYYHSTDNFDKGLKILFRLATVVPKELEILIKEALTFKRNETKDDWELREFYDKIIEFTLSYYNAWQVHYVLPDLVCEAALQVWKPKPKKKDDWGHDSSFDRLT